MSLVGGCLLPSCGETAPFDLLEHASWYGATSANLRMFKMPLNTIIETCSVSQQVLLMPLLVQRTLGHELCLHMPNTTRSHNPASVSDAAPVCDRTLALRVLPGDVTEGFDIIAVWIADKVAVCLVQRLSLHDVSKAAIASPEGGDGSSPRWAVGIAPSIEQMDRGRWVGD